MNSNNKCRGVAQFGSALVSGTRGREFESRRPDQIKNFRNRMRMRFFLYAEALKGERKKGKKAIHAIFMQYLLQLSI